MKILHSSFFMLRNKKNAAAISTKLKTIAIFFCEDFVNFQMHNPYCLGADISACGKRSMYCFSVPPPRPAF